MCGSVVNSVVMIHSVFWFVTLFGCVVMFVICSGLLLAVVFAVIWFRLWFWWPFFGLFSVWVLILNWFGSWL